MEELKEFVFYQNNQGDGEEKKGWRVKPALFEGANKHRVMRTLQRGVKGVEAGVRHPYTGIASKLHLEVVIGEGRVLGGGVQRVQSILIPLSFSSPPSHHSLT